MKREAIQKFINLVKYIDSVDDYFEVVCRKNTQTRNHLALTVKRLRTGDKLIQGKADIIYFFQCNYSLSMRNLVYRSKVEELLCQ